MASTPDFFDAGNPPTVVDPPASALLVTNHLNLMYMLAAGLLMPPSGFSGKHYRDPLAAFPGWIPLFIGEAFKAAIEEAVSEADHLNPCLAQVSLRHLAGRMMILRDSGIGVLRFPAELDGTERVIFVPAPLPASWIETILFRSNDEKRTCEADARDFGNVPLSDFARKVATRRFANKPFDAAWPPGFDLPQRAAPLEAPLAAGGVMAMLLRVANQGPLGVRACRLAFDPDDGQAPEIEDPLFAGLGPWMCNAEAPGNGDVPETPSDPDRLQSESHRRVLWGAVGRIVAWKGSRSAGSAEDVLLDHLETASRELDSRIRRGVMKLRDTLESLTGLGEYTATELFERHATPLSRAMMLFFLRRDCAGLLDFRNSLLTERDWLAAAILFGAREGWLGLPLGLREPRALSATVSHRMARMAHRMAGTGIELGPAPPRIQPLREPFGDGSGWRVRENSAARLLAREQGWDCIRTRIKLGPGAYALEVNRGGAQIVLEGEPRAVESEVDPTRFFRHLAQERIPVKVEAKVREALTG